MMGLALTWVKDNWRFVAGLTTIVFVFATGYYKGYSHEHAKFEQHLQTDATLMAVAKAENERRLKEQEIITANVTKEYADAIAKINDYYKSHPHIVRLCRPNKTNTLSTKSESTSGISATVNGIAEVITEIDLQKVNQETLQCQALIAWEKRQEEVQ